MNSYYSMLVNLSGRLCVVVGGGAVAERKIAALLEASANLTVISPAFTKAITEWINEGRIQAIRRAYTSKDGAGAFLVIAATNVEAVNINVFRDAIKRNQLVNVVDREDLSSFISPSTFSRGKLQISISTSGASPSLAKIIRQDLEFRYGGEYEIYLDFLSEYRLKVKEQVGDLQCRQLMYREMMQMDILQIIRSGEFEAFKKQAFERLGG